MPTKAETNRRKETKLELRNQAKLKFLKSVPVSIEELQKLFDWLDFQLSENGCNDTLALTKSFIKQNNLPEEHLIKWLKENGGYCDCEVLANVEDTLNEI